MMALVRKRKLRSGHRSSATRTMNAAFDIVKAGSFEEAEMAKLSYYEATLKTKVERLCELDEENRDETPEDELENEIEQADLFIERIRLQLIELEGAIKKVTSTKGAATGGSPPPQQPPRSSPPQSASRGSRSSSSSSSRTSTPESSTPVLQMPTTGVKLPKLSLKHFVGMRLLGPLFGTHLNLQCMRIPPYQILTSSII